MSPCFAGCIVWILGAEASNEHLRGCLVPWVARRSLQMESKVVSRAIELVAQWAVSICFVPCDLLMDATCFRTSSWVAVSRGVVERE